MMSSHLALPRDGHLQAVLYIFAYLKKYHNTEIMYAPSDTVIDEEQFDCHDWASSELEVTSKRNSQETCPKEEAWDLSCVQWLMQTMLQTQRLEDLEHVF